MQDYAIIYDILKTKRDFDFNLLLLHEKAGVKTIPILVSDTFQDIFEDDLPYKSGEKMFQCLENIANGYNTNVAYHTAVL